MQAFNLLSSSVYQVNRTAVLIAAGVTVAGVTTLVCTCCAISRFARRIMPIPITIGPGHPQRHVVCGDLDSMQPSHRATQDSTVSSRANTWDITQLSCEHLDRTQLFQQLYHALKPNQARMQSKQQKLQVSLCLELIAAVVGRDEERAIPAALHAMRAVAFQPRMFYSNHYAGKWFTEIMVCFAQHLTGHKLGESRRGDIAIAEEVCIRTWPNCFHGTNRSALDGILQYGLDTHTRPEDHGNIDKFNRWWQKLGGKGSQYVGGDRGAFYVSQSADKSAHEYAPFAPEWLKLQTEDVLGYDFELNTEELPGWNRDRIAGANFVQLSEALEQALSNPRTLAGRLDESQKERVRTYFHTHWRRYRTNPEAFMICTKWVTPTNLTGDELLQRLTGYNNPTKKELWEGLRQCIDRRWEQNNVRVNSSADIDQNALFYVKIPIPGQRVPIPASHPSVQGEAADRVDSHQGMPRTHA